MEMLTQLWDSTNGMCGVELKSKSAIANLRAIEKLYEYERNGLAPQQVKELTEGNRWIPVSEKLPNTHEESEDVFDINTLAIIDTKYHMCSDLVLVTVVDLEKENIFVCDDCLCDGKWSNFCQEMFQITAWKPLPKPYMEVLVGGNNVN